VPTGPTGLTICPARSAPAAIAHVTRDFSTLVSALNQTATRPTSNMCDPQGDEVVAYQARFDYAEGPAVVVSISKNCFPRLSNGSLDADGSAQIWAMVDELAHHPTQT
jgi:hypothetical protein